MKFFILFVEYGLKEENCIFFFIIDFLFIKRRDGFFLKGNNERKWYVGRICNGDDVFCLYIIMGFLMIVWCFLKVIFFFILLCFY